MNDQDLLARISSNMNIMAGKPVIRGTRLTAEYILRLMAHGATEQEILIEYDGLTPEDIRACFLVASNSLEKSTVLPLPVEAVQMRFLVDECTGPAVAAWLRIQGHTVFSVYEQASGIDDDDVIQRAFDGNWILITNDQDFGEKVYRNRHPHHGVILMRLDDDRSAVQVETLRRLLHTHAHQLANQFVVVTESRVRFASS